MKERDFDIRVERMVSLSLFILIGFRREIRNDKFDMTFVDFLCFCYFGLVLLYYHPIQILVQGKLPPTIHLLLFFFY